MHCNIHTYSIISIVAIFTYCMEMTDTHIFPKWLYTLWVVAVVGMIEGLSMLRKGKGKGKRRKIKEKTWFVTVIFLCFCQSVYAIIQEFGIVSSCFPFQVVGSFDNPAGLVACLCIGMPCCFRLFQTEKRKTSKKMIIAVAIFIGFALVLSESRAGILAGIFFPLVWYMFDSAQKRWLQTTMLGICITLLPIMYIAKKDSADGRLLMLRCGWDMIKEKPLLGHGSDGIQAHYMDYQAKWLAEHSESTLCTLADNVKSVFNEYLTIGICFGIVGWLILGGFVFFMINCYFKVPSEDGKCALMSLATIGILGCFSYPLSYPFTWIVLILNSYILLHRAYRIPPLKNKICRYTVSFIVFGSSSVLLYAMAKRTSAEFEWGEISRLNLREEGKEVFSRYEKLMPILGNEPYFLYNYAAELYAAKHYKEALYIAQRCRTHWADYDLELLIGELFNELHQYEEAEDHFQLASNMCPTRFIPLYKLYQIYEKIGDEEKVNQMATLILNKPTKVESGTVKCIRERVKNM